MEEYTLDLGIICEEEYLKRALKLFNLVLPEKESCEMQRLFLFSIIQRAMLTSKGIETLIEDDNYEAAMPLMRVLFDCSLQIQAAKMAKNETSYYRSILSGKEIRDIENKQGGYLSERKIVSSFDNEKWIEGVSNLYDALNKHVHFSPTHLRQIVDNNKNISIGKRMVCNNPEHVENIIEHYNTITLFVIRMLDSSLDDLKRCQQ